MEKRKAGIDLDKTIFDCKCILYTLANRLHWNKNKKLKHHVVPQGGVYKASLANKLFKLLNPNFYFTFPHAVETINELPDLGFEVHLVSNRPKIRPVVALTIMCLENYGLKYDKLVLGCNNKQEYARVNNLDYFIDNTESICQNFALKTNVKPLCFKPTLKDDSTDRLSLSDVSKFSSWDGIGEFFKTEEKKVGVAKMAIAKLKNDAAKTFISRGLCLPEPQKSR